jgi:hypothetical protein
MLRFNRGIFSTCCPYCRSIDFRGVDIRNALERAFLWLLHPYRCELCGRHFFLFRWQMPLADAT